MIRRYANDKRVLAWDLFNEPDNSNGNSYGPSELKDKDAQAARLVRSSFEWSRAIGPSQPLTVGLWSGPAWNEPAKLDQVHRAAVELSDVISFHDYGQPESMENRIHQFARTAGRCSAPNTWPAATAAHSRRFCRSSSRKKWPPTVGVSSTEKRRRNPWSTWQMPILGEPDPWHHDIFHADGKPYREAEVKLIRELTKP